MKKYVVIYHSTKGWKHGKIYTKNNVSKTILGSLKKMTNK
jgi:hypothetical protein